jgi:hypothetical protein
MSTAKYKKQRQEYAVLPEARECVLIDGEFYGVCANIRYKRTETHGRWLRQSTSGWVGVRRDCVPETLKQAYATMVQTLQGLGVQGTQR